MLIYMVPTNKLSVFPISYNNRQIHIILQKMHHLKVC